MLVHEATFIDDERDARARDRPLHRPPGRRARRATPSVRLLALTHLSTRYFPRDVRDEARAVFPATVVPRDFDAIEVPFPERGRAAASMDAGPNREPEPARPPAAERRAAGGRCARAQPSKPLLGSSAAAP